MEDLSTLMASTPGADTMHRLLVDEGISEITVNAHNVIYVTRDGVRSRINDTVFRNQADYIAWLDSLLTANTDARWGTLALAEGKTDVIEASLRGDDLYGSIHVALPCITKRQPILTVRKQPRRHITLDQMLSQGMLSQQMYGFLEQAMRGRLNVLVAGGSGAGKTTLVRALARFVDPAHRVLTCEEIDELNLELDNVVTLFTHAEKDDHGRLLWETTLDDLVRDALRMRPDRIWVGEVRGREAHSLVKACNTGHDGSLTTVHADSDRAAIDNLITYVMEDGVTEDVARTAIVRAFDIVVLIKRGAYGRRVIESITEVESAIEGKQVRLTPLFGYNYDYDDFIQQGSPTPELLRKLHRAGVNPRPLAA